MSPAKKTGPTHSPASAAGRSTSASRALSALVASMLQHAAGVAPATPTKRRTASAQRLLDAMRQPDPEGDVVLEAAISGLFADAELPSVRVNRDNSEYSLVERSDEEYQRWFNMPWED